MPEVPATAQIFAPASYWRESPALLDEVANGCGPGGIGDKLVPDTLWFLNIRPACRVHDYMYWRGRTLADKSEADRVFLNNMIRIIDAKTRWGWLRWLRYRRAYKYFEAVHLGGGPYFWRGKNRPGEMGETR